MPVSPLERILLASSTPPYVSISLVGSRFLFAKCYLELPRLQIYSDLLSGAFHDITDGGNPGCNTEGFTAVPGWDPVTGLGTPHFPKLVARWLLLP